MTGFLFIPSFLIAEFTCVFQGAAGPKTGAITVSSKP